MAIYWGSYHAHMRVGIGVVQRPATVGQSTTSVILDLEVWVQMDGSSSQYINNGSLTYSGAWSGGATVTINLGPGQAARVVATSVTYDTIVGSSQQKLFGATISHYHGTSYAGKPWTIPARPAAPPSAPNAPSALAVTRGSDVQHTLTWSRNSVYTSVVVQRSTDNGPWTQVGKPTGNAFSWVDTTTQANRKYQYRVAGVNDGGQSDWSLMATTYTTPAAPASVTATRIGANIEVAGAGLPPYASSYDVMDGDAVVAAGVGLPWTHTAPSILVAHTYRVRSKRDGLVSEWSAASPTVQLTAPPAAPSTLVPNGAAVLGDVASMPMSWRHNPVDASQQSQFQIRWRPATGGAWTERTAVASTTEATAIATPATVFGGYRVIEWQVRTKGAHATWSPWSATATVDLLQQPQVSITAPAPAVDRPTITVSWSWFQGQGRPQSSWQLELLDGDGQAVETRSGVGASTSLALYTRLQDGSSYTVRVRAATGEVWSDWATRAHLVAFVPPAPPLLFGEWQDAAGAVSVSVGQAIRDLGPEITQLFTNPELRGSGGWAEVRRNRAVNPVAGSTGWYMAWGTGGAGTTSVASNGPAGVPMMEAVFSTAPSGGIRRFVFHNLVTQIPVTVGEVLDLSGYAAADTVNPGAKVHLQIDWQNGGTWVSGASGAVLDAPSSPGTAARVTMTTPAVPAGVTHVRVFMTFSGHASAVGDRYYAGALMVGPGAYMDGDTKPEGLVQAEDFRTRWVGTPGASASVLEIENVQGFASAGCILGVSTKNGRPAARQIVTAKSDGDWYSHRLVQGLSVSQTLRATATLDAPIVPHRGGPAIRLETDPNTGFAPTVAGVHDITVSASRPGPSAMWRLLPGMLAGQGDVWWTDIGLFAGSYAGGVFSGASGIVDTGAGMKRTKWDGAPHASTSSTLPAPVVVSVDVLRSVDGGRTWETVIEGADPDLVLDDWEALSWGQTMYRAVAYTDTGASAVTDLTVVAESSAMWLSGGDGYTVAARLPYDPSLKIDAGRARSVQRYEGRPHGVAYAGEHVSRVVDASGSILELDDANASTARMEAIAQTESPLHLYRDPDGRRIYGSLSNVSLPRKTGASGGAVWGWGFQLEETDH